MATPLTFVRRIEKFAFTYIFADLLILITAIVIIVYSSLHIKDKGWGENIEMFNTSTWLTMIGSAVYSYEGIGVVIPLLEVTEKPEQFPKILLFVLMTVMILYTGFGEFNYCAYGGQLEDPLITTYLDQGVLVWIIKIFFSINIIFTYTLMIFPANIIIEGYVYRNMEKSFKRQMLKNLTRSIMVAFTVTFCLLL